MDLLTKDEYQAIAATLEFPTEAFIDGGFRPAKSGQTFASMNPATGKQLTSMRPLPKRRCEQHPISTFSLQTVRLCLIPIVRMGKRARCRIVFHCIHYCKRKSTCSVEAQFEEYYSL